MGPTQPACFVHIEFFFKISCIVRIINFFSYSKYFQDLETSYEILVVLEPSPAAGTSQIHPKKDLPAPLVFLEIFDSEKFQNWLELF
jgi:hypothetical protein